MPETTRPPLPVFVDRDPQSGAVTATSYASIEAMMRQRYPLPDSLPAQVRDQMVVARSYFAHAYEQANAGRLELFGYLTNDAFLKTMLAIEIALRDRLGREPKKANLTSMLKEAQELGLIPTSAELEQQAKALGINWDDLKQNRNDITHANPDHPVVGPAAATFIEFLFARIVELYSAPPPANESVDGRR